MAGEQTTLIGFIHEELCGRLWKRSKAMASHSTMPRSQWRLMFLSDLSSSYLITCFASVTFKVVTVQGRARASNFGGLFWFWPWEYSQLPSWATQYDEDLVRSVRLAFRVTAWVRVFIAHLLPSPRAKCLGNSSCASSPFYSSRNYFLFFKHREVLFRNTMAVKLYSLRWGTMSNRMQDKCTNGVFTISEVPTVNRF